MKSLQLALLFFLCAATFNVAAVCSFYDGHAQSTVAINIPNNISIPRDAPNGTIIYESARTITNNVSSSYKCTSDFMRGIKNNVGVDTATKLLAIGDTGIAWQWILGEGEGVSGDLGGDMKTAGGYGFNGVSHRIRLVKVGNIKANAKIPTGILGYYKAGEVLPLAMTTNGMVVVAQSCEAPDVQVNMGEHNLSAFSKSGSHSIPTSFNIELKNCPAGIKK